MPNCEHLKKKLTLLLAENSPSPLPWRLVHFLYLAEFYLIILKSEPRACAGLVLFNDLGIPHPNGGPKHPMFMKGGDKTLGHNNSKNSNKRQAKRSTVRYSCTKDILKAIKHLHPLPAVILEHRKLTALITKYIDVLPKYIRYSARLDMDR